MSEKITTLGRLEKTQEEIDRDAREAIENPNNWTEQDIEWMQRELGYPKPLSRQELIKKLDSAKDFFGTVKNLDKDLK